jgi:hypothetical protein
MIGDFWAMLIALPVGVCIALSVCAVAFLWLLRMYLDN